MRYYYLILCLGLIACSSSKDTTSKVDCSSYNIKNESQISFSERLVNYKFNKVYREIRFCTHHPCIASKIVYDEFGKWTAISLDKTNNNPLLLWSNIKIEGIDYLVNIASSSYQDQYSSLMLFDNEGNDLLRDDSKDKEKLISFFIKKINKRSTPRKTTFWKTYLREARPISYKIYHN